MTAGPAQTLEFNSIGSYGHGMGLEGYESIGYNSQSSINLADRLIRTHQGCAPCPGDESTEWGKLPLLCVSHAGKESHGLNTIPSDRSHVTWTESNGKYQGYVVVPNK